LRGGDGRSLTTVLRSKSEQLENALRQLESVEAALEEAVEDGYRLKNKLASATEEVEWTREQSKELRIQVVKRQQ
jgi:chromosome segregation ATPase